MVVAAALLALLLTPLASSDRCHLVENKRIETVRCDAAQSAAAHHEAPPPGTRNGRPADEAPEERNRSGETEREARSPTVADETLRAQELERELAAAERRLRELDAQSANAERQRAIAIDQREAALKRLRAIRQVLTAERTRQEQAVRAWERRARALAATTTDLQQVERALARGSSEGASAVLARAGDVLSKVHSREGTASVATARNALARGDLYDARQAVSKAIVSAERSSATAAH